jgi:hypothetical protein
MGMGDYCMLRPALVCTCGRGRRGSSVFKKKVGLLVEWALEQLTEGDHEESHCFCRIVGCSCFSFGL